MGVRRSRYTINCRTIYVLFFFYIMFDVITPRVGGTPVLYIVEEIVYLS